MNFKLTKAGFATLALLAVPFAAKAADVPIKAPFYKSAPVSYYNWTGFYAGVNAGYGMGILDLVGAARSRHQAQGLAVRRHRSATTGSPAPSSTALRATSTGRT